MNKKRGKDIIIVTLITLGIFLLLEVSIRVFYPNVMCQYTPMVWEYDPGVLGPFQPNTRTIQFLWKGLPFLMTTNNEGFRNLRNIKREKEKGGLRILAVGDSLTQGLYVPDEDTYTWFLEDKLRKKLPDRTVEVLNSGRGGYSIDDELAYLETRGMKTNSDIVILGFSQNDVYDLGSYKSLENTKRELSRGYPKWMYEVGITAMALNVKRSLMLRAIASSQNTTPDAHELSTIQNKHEREWHIYEHLLGRMVKLLRDRGKKIVMLLIPSYFQFQEGYNDDARQKVLQIAENLQIHYVCDLFEEFKRIPSEYLYLVPRNKHLTRYGNMKMAEILMKYMETSGVLKETLQQIDKQE